jgi:hypothetical protein
VARFRFCATVIRCRRVRPQDVRAAGGKRFTVRQNDLVCGRFLFVDKGAVRRTLEYFRLPNNRCRQQRHR